jgi:hypothetical protein
MPGTVRNLTALVARCEALIAQLDELEKSAMRASLQDELRGTAHRTRKQLQWLREPLDSRRGDAGDRRWP